MARSEKSRTCSKSHGKLDPPWRSPDDAPCSTGTSGWSDAVRCGASIVRRKMPFLALNHEGGTPDAPAYT